MHQALEMSAGAMAMNKDMSPTLFGFMLYYKKWKMNS